MAYKVYKELERVLKRLDTGMSVDRILEAAKTITTIKIRLPNGKVCFRTLYTSAQHKAVKSLVDALACAHEREGDA